MNINKKLMKQQTIFSMQNFTDRCVHL